MTAWLAIARSAHFAAACMLFGLTAFSFYVRVRGEGAEPSGRLLRVLAGLAAATTALVLGAAAANMTGDVSALASPTAIWDVVQGTVFGQVWGLRLLLALAVLGLALRRRPWDGVMAIGSALLLVTIAFSGHSRMQSGALGWAHVFADALHLMAAGAWIGGLLALLLALRLRRLGREGVAAGVLEQFSGMGYYAVAVLVLTGVLKSWLLVGGPGGLFATPYGWVLDAKLVLFAGMGALALSNRLWITPALEARPDDPSLWLHRLRRQVTLEFALGLLVLAAAGLLGALEPPVS
jgi:putative copper resistance protein D